MDKDARKLLWEESKFFFWMLFWMIIVPGLCIVAASALGWIK